MRYQGTGGIGDRAIQNGPPLPQRPLAEKTTDSFLFAVRLHKRVVVWYIVGPVVETG